MKAKMDKVEIATYVRIVSEARKRRATDDEILAQLRNARAPEDETQELLNRITHGLRGGVQFAMTGGVSGHGMPEGTCPVYDAAFVMGKSALSGAARDVWVKRIALVVLAMTVIAVLIYFTTS